MGKERFFKVYANLPVNVREEVILVLAEAKGPITWNVAYLEMSSGTAPAKTILDKLIKFDFV